MMRQYGARKAALPLESGLGSTNPISGTAARGSSFLREVVYLPRRVKRTNYQSARKNYSSLYQTMFDTFYGLC